MSINFPPSPSFGDRFSFDTKTWEWNGVIWKNVSTGGGGGSGGTGAAYISPDPPATPTSGQFWFDEDTGSTYIYYDSATPSPVWVEVGGSASLPHSACCLVYNGPVDSYSIDTTVDATATGWTATYVVAHARIWVQNNTGGSGLVELDGAFTIAGSDQTGSSTTLLRLTIPDGEGLLLADHCTISSASNIGYRVTNIGATNVDVTVNITVTEVDAAQACCTGPM